MDEYMNDSPEFVKIKAKEIIDEVNKVIIGQYEFVEQLVIILLTGGHALIEGVPGIGKTLTAKTLARTVKSDFKRIQFTPDLMPSDVIGTKVFDTKSGNFFLKIGPLFTNILLADEINRTPPKTQAALLEAMEEKSITIDGETHILSEPFMVIATQNPVEYEGTYPLPEAQLDRFMMKLNVNYIPQKFENSLLLNYNPDKDIKKEEYDVKAVCDVNDILKCRKIINSIKVDEGVVNYITSIVRATRNSPSLILGASTRAAIALLLTSKAFAALQGKSYITPDDVKDMATPTLRHRIVLKPEAGIDGVNNDDIIKSILAKIEVPR